MVAHVATIEEHQGVYNRDYINSILSERYLLRQENSELKGRIDSLEGTVAYLGRELDLERTRLRVARECRASAEGDREVLLRAYETVRADRDRLERETVQAERDRLERRRWWKPWTW